MSSVVDRFRVALALWRSLTLPERGALTTYALATLLRERTPWAPAEMWLRIGGQRFRVAPARGELAAYLEIWVQRSYEQAPGFVAGPGWSVVDVGANVGFFTVRQAVNGARVIASRTRTRAPGSCAMSRRMASETA